MKAPTLRLALLATCSLAASQALAADMEMPAPDLRPASYELGIGVFGETRAVDAWYDNSCDCARDVSGIGYGAGLKASLDYKSEGWFAGVVGDWTFGGNAAFDHRPDEPASLDLPYLGTLRARAGLTNGDAAIYLTGGLAMAKAELGVFVPAETDMGTVMEHDEGSDWTLGWTVGTGVSYGLTDNVSIDLEYLYVQLDGIEYDLGSMSENDPSAYLSMDGMHSVRMGVNYLFSM